MITRLPTSCLGCGNQICFRLAIPREDPITFWATCPHCRVRLNGAVTADPEIGITSFTIDGVPVEISEESGSQRIVNIYTDLPVDMAPHSLADPNGSAFLMHVGVLGDKFVDWHKRTQTFHGLVDVEWPHLRRWWTYYLDQDFDLFDKNFDDRFGSYESPLENAARRDDQIHRAIEIVCLSMFGPDYLRMTESARRSFPGPDPLSATRACDDLDRQGWIARAQFELFELLDRYIDARYRWVPGTILSAYEEGGVEWDRSWRLLRDDFASLAALYQAAFERCYDYVGPVMMLSNLCAGRQSTSFPDGQRLTLKSYLRKTSHHKESVIKQYSWGTLFLRHFNRDLRNAIAHEKLEFDFRSDLVTFKGTSITYLEFVRLTAEPFEVIMFLLGSIKLIAMVARDVSLPRQ